MILFIIYYENMWYDFGKKLEKFMIILHKDVYF
jgi:hypothetical protein